MLILSEFRANDPGFLAALVPRPRLNLTRFHGVFAPNIAVAYAYGSFLPP